MLSKFRQYLLIWQVYMSDKKEITNTLDSS